MVMYTKFPSSMRAKCECGSCVVETRQTPTVRLNCHCTICQAFISEAYSDVMVVPATCAVFKNEESVTFLKYKKFRLPPPNLARGRCKTCGKPFIETWGIGSAHVLLFIRSIWFERPDLLPKPEAHIFYEHRIRDIQDNIPKYNGYFPSQWALAKMIVHAVAR